jgi:hypothetical protein
MRHSNKPWRNWSVAGACAVLGMATLAGCGGGGGTQQQNSSSRTLTTLSIQGTLDPATGQFTQAMGTFEKFTGTLLPNPTTDTTPFPPVDPGLGGSVYTGTYTLNPGESGVFTFTVLPDSSAEGVAVPTDFYRYQADPTSTQTGTATVSLQVSGSTGSGKIQLSNGVQGTIKITGVTLLSAQVRPHK